MSTVALAPCSLCPLCSTAALPRCRYLDPRPAANPLSRTSHTSGGPTYVCVDCGKAEGLMRMMQGLTFPMARVAVYNEREQQRRGLGPDFAFMTMATLPPGQDALEYETDLMSEDEVEDKRMEPRPCLMCRGQTEPDRTGLCYRCSEGF